MLKKHFPFKRLRNTLMVAFLILSLVPLTVIALFFLHSHSKDLQEQSHSYLISVRDTKRQQLQDYVNAKESEVIGFVRSELAYASGGRFYGLVNAFRSLGLNIEDARKNAQDRYVEGSGNKIKNLIARDSDDYVGSERYRLLHKRYHRTYVELLKRSDFDDVLLVDREGNVTYSVLKNGYYGTNLLDGRYKDTNLGKTFHYIKQQLSSQQYEPDAPIPVEISDFAQEGDNLYAWLAAPIMQQGFLHSYALLRLPIDGVSKLIEDNNTSAQILLVGPDMTPRSLNLTQEVIDSNASILKSAVDGLTEVENYENQSGQHIIAAITPVPLNGVHWGLSVQLAEDVAHARIHNLEKVFVLAMLFASALVIIASHIFSNFITAPLLKLTWAAEKVSAGDLDESVINTNRKDEIGRLAVSFERMQRSIREKILTIRKQNEELENNLQIIQQQNNELQLTDKLKDEFLATTSHELRTPLHGMIGIAEALGAGASGTIPANQKYQLDIIINSGQRLANLVDDLLDYHKMRYGNLKISKKATDLFHATSIVLQLSTHLLGKKRIRIINQIPIDMPLVVSDPQRLEQVLYNLIGNAIKYTDEGKIIISAENLQNQMRVQIVDTGQGIPAEFLEHIFEPLVQGNGKSVRYKQGAGLGLSISRQLIELMGGSLYVSSQQDVGTTFSFTLPLAKEDIEKYEPVEADYSYQLSPVQELPDIDTLSVNENFDGPLVIAADDESVNLSVLKNFLAMEGFRVKTATEGTEVLQLVEEEKPDIILLDIMMPGLNGYEVCRSIRTDYTQTELPIIMLTALNQAEDRLEGFNSGANDYLSKPFNRQELAARIRVHISASQNEQQKEQNQKLIVEIEKRTKAENELLATQKRLIEQLDGAPEAILCLNNALQVRFANEAASVLFRRTVDQLKRSNADEIIATKYLNSDQEHYCGEIDIFSGTQRLKVTGDIIKLPESSGINSMFIFDIDGEVNTNRVRKLETAVDALSNYAFKGGEENLDKLKQLGDEFKGIVDKASGSTKDKQTLLRETLVAAMTTALSYWEHTTGKTKFNFAEESGLWKVYLDRSTLQTRTLDKYLRVETVPKTPRWRTVLSSVEFILEHCHEQTELRKELEAIKQRLNRLVSA
ncbi:response regulator [Vibrio hannami]|uniref:response regulator n=1 Tax=Vibrio hannami TaxID=2717094 RepID=UPI003EBE840D